MSQTSVENNTSQTPIILQVASLAPLITVVAMVLSAFHVAGFVFAFDPRLLDFYTFSDFAASLITVLPIFVLAALAFPVVAALNWLVVRSIGRLWRPNESSAEDIPGSSWLNASPFYAYGLYNLLTEPFPMLYTYNFIALAILFHIYQVGRPKFNGISLSSTLRWAILFTALLAFIMLGLGHDRIQKLKATEESEAQYRLGETEYLYIKPIERGTILYAQGGRLTFRSNNGEIQYSKVLEKPELTSILCRVIDLGCNWGKDAKPAQHETEAPKNANVVTKESK